MDETNGRRRLGAQPRRKLQGALWARRCPACRQKALTWSSAVGAVVCGSCGARRQPEDLGLTWRPGGPNHRHSYWAAS